MPNNTPAAIFAAREQERNMTGPMNFVVDPSVIFAPKHVLYIFNIGPMAHTVFKGSAGPVGGYKIEPCEKGEPYSRPLIIPSLVVDTYMVENEIKTHSVTGEFMCQDIVHPMIGRTWSVGKNLDDFGVFWTKNNPPKPEEIDKARGSFAEACGEAPEGSGAGQTSGHKGGGRCRQGLWPGRDGGAPQSHRKSRSGYRLWRSRNRGQWRGDG